MHECVKQAGTREWEDLCSHKWTELLREQGMGQADLLSIRCLLHTLLPLAQDAAAPLYPLTDATRWHKVRAGIKVATVEISKDALSKIPVHLLNPKQQSCPDTFLRGCRTVEIPAQSWFSLKIPEALKKLVTSRSVQICIQRGKKCNLQCGYPPYMTPVWRGMWLVMRSALSLTPRNFQNIISWILMSKSLG